MIIQAAEAARLAAEAEAKLALKSSSAPVEQGGSPVSDVRQMVEGGAAPGEVAAFVKQLVVPGGQPGKALVPELMWFWSRMDSGYCTDGWG